MSNRPEHVVGSGNVFADIGVAEPELALAKATIVQQIAAVIEERGLTQKQAGELLHLDQASLSKLLRGRVRGYSLERLVRFLNLLDFDVELRVAPSSGQSKESGHGRFVVSGADLPAVTGLTPGHRN